MSGIGKAHVRLSVVFDKSALQRWQLWLLEDLARIPELNTRVVFAAGQWGLPASVSLLLQLENVLGRDLGAVGLKPVTPGELIAASGGNTDPDATADLVLDLSGAEQTSRGGVRTLTPLFDGSAHPHALWLALLDGVAPDFSLRDSAGPTPLCIARPAAENPHRLAYSFEAMASRLVESLYVSIRDLAAGQPLMARSAPGRLTVREGTASRFVSKLVRDKALLRLTRTVRRVPQWAVAVGRMSGDLPWRGGLVDPSRFTLLRDDGRRFYADPFLFQHEARTYLFVEELPYATGRGMISVSEIASNGAPSRPRPVLECGHHLSCPQVFARDGAVWMLAEAHCSGGLTLYRADRFPERWLPVARLLDEPVHDPLFFEYEGRLWITAATQTRCSSSWDSLSLYHATSLTGPWHPHPLNPVRIDRAGARPGGVPFQHQGTLLRWAQDCSSMYGEALRLHRVDRLDTAGYLETPVGTLRFPPDLGLSGPHTFNRAGGMEAIDAFGPREQLDQFGRAGRPTTTDVVTQTSSRSVDASVLQLISGCAPMLAP